jgi:hypothetical protein
MAMGAITFDQLDVTMITNPQKNIMYKGMLDGQTPTFKKLIPTEMAAMRFHTGKMAGKCFTLVNLIDCCFIQIGIDPDDLVVLICDTGDVRHAMALLKFEKGLILVNLMKVDLLRKHITNDFRPYNITGIYNNKFSREVNFKVKRSDLETIMNLSDKPLLKSFIEHYDLESDFTEYSFEET